MSKWPLRSELPPLPKLLPKLLPKRRDFVGAIGCLVGAILGSIAWTASAFAESASDRGVSMFTEFATGNLQLAGTDPRPPHQPPRPLSNPRWALSSILKSSVPPAKASRSS